MEVRMGRPPKIHYSDYKLKGVWARKAKILERQEAFGEKSDILELMLVKGQEARRKHF
jgi:hypothetical protein